MKKVILLVVDALATRVLEPAMEEGRLPNLKALADRGVLRPRCTSIFPSITPAATCSIATGAYPAEHNIAGAFWYDEDDDSVAYYGDDFWVLVEKGLGEYFNDFLVKLNYSRLATPTIFETVERQGRSSGCLNYMWFRGNVTYRVNAPLLLELLPGVTFAEEIRGPRVLGLADFARSQLASGEELSASGGMTRRFGFHDDTTGEFLVQLAEADELPDFTLAYFPNNDFDSHSVGPQEAVSTLENVDRHLGEFLEAGGGLENMLQRHAFLVTGDHSQSDLDEDRSRRGIALDEALEDFSVVPAGSDWSEEGEELMICPNMRAALFYLRGCSAETRGRIVRRLLEDDRIDQAIYTDETEDPERSPRHFFVETSDRGGLEFWAGAEGPQTARDEYGNRWVWRGDLSALGAEVCEGTLSYGDYPNALERVAMAFSPTCGDLWITARLGHEFHVAETALHSGGSHGSLHAEDSSSPLLAAGLPDDVPVPESPRLVDVVPLCLAALGLSPEREAGAPHYERFASASNKRSFARTPPGAE